jgi:hypothetical protein
MTAAEKRVICISWHATLAETRELLLRKAGASSVLSALYEKEARSACQEKADLLVLGHSVPREEKRLLIKCFRQHSSAPILSLLNWGEDKLPEATLAVQGSKPDEFIRVVKQILQ